MTKKDFIEQWRETEGTERAGMIYDLFQSILEAVGNPGRVEPEKPRYEWDECELRSTDKGGRIVACIYSNFPGDIEGARADVLARAEAGR